MKLRTKIVITGAAAVLGGFGIANAAGYPGLSGSLFDGSNTAQTQPADQPATNQSVTPVDTASTTPTSNQGSSASITSDVPTNSASAPVSKPAPTPKPATIYSSQPSADTPCRLRTENTYTNDCGNTTTQQSTAQAAPTTQDPAPTDTTTPVSNDNNTVSNPNQN